MSSPQERLAELGLSVPEVVPPLAVYVPARRSGAYVHTSGQLPLRDGALLATGKVGAQVSAEQATQCAQQAALNAIAAVASQVQPSDVVAVVKVVVYVASAPDFTGQPAVANGASELLGQVFGDAGHHARSAVGVTALPLDAPVEVEILVEVR
jgi:enamine deaminase RidA (YjgF/YER057c/UK114 family)